jgi:hypothetical protein
VHLRRREGHLHGRWSLVKLLGAISSTWVMMYGAATRARARVLSTSGNLKLAAGLGYL